MRCGGGQVADATLEHRARSLYVGAAVGESVVGDEVVGDEVGKALNSSGTFAAHLRVFCGSALATPSIELAVFAWQRQTQRSPPEYLQPSLRLEVCSKGFQ